MEVPPVNFFESRGGRPSANVQEKCDSALVFVNRFLEIGNEFSGFDNGVS